MEQRRRQRGWTIAVGVAAAAIVVAGGATFALASTSLNDSPGERVGVTGVRIDVGTDSPSTPSDPSPTPSPFRLTITAATTAGAAKAARAATTAAAAVTAKSPRDARRASTLHTLAAWFACHIACVFHPVGAPMSSVDSAPSGKFDKCLASRRFQSQSGSIVPSR